MLIQLSFFWPCKPCCAQEGGHVWLCTHSSCVEEPLQQALVVVGVPRLAGAVTVTARAAQGQRVPQGARLLPQLPRAEIRAVGTGERHISVPGRPQGMGTASPWVWAVLAPPGAQPWASLRDTWGKHPCPPGKGVSGNWGTAWVRAISAEISPNPAQRQWNAN